MTRRAFTIVELLVVVAVLAILAALLFPVLSSSRSRARDVSCLANLKQIGSAIEIYKQDNDGAFPIAPQFKVRRKWPHTNWTEGFARWVELVYPYVNHGVQFDEEVAFRGVFHCPMDNGYRGPSYAINGWFLDKGLKDGQLAHPSETILLGEKRGAIAQQQFAWWIYPWPQWPLKGGTPITPAQEARINAIRQFGTDITGTEEEGAPPPAAHEQLEAAGLQTLRHRDGSYYLFTDGSVRWSKLNRVWGNATTTNQFHPFR